MITLLEMGNIPKAGCYIDMSIIHFMFPLRYLLDDYSAVIQNSAYNSLLADGGALSALSVNNL